MKVEKLIQEKVKAETLREEKIRKENIEKKIKTIIYLKILMKLVKGKKSK